MSPIHRIFLEVKLIKSQLNFLILISKHIIKYLSLFYPTIRELNLKLIKFKNVEF